MKIFFPKEQQDELRTSIVPSVVQKLVALKLTVFVEEGVGETVSLNDDVYVEAGAKITKNRIEALSNADIVCRLNDFYDQNEESGSMFGLILGRKSSQCDLPESAKEM